MMSSNYYILFHQILKTKSQHYLSVGINVTSFLTNLVYFLSSGAVALFVAHHQDQVHAGLAVGWVGREGALGLQAAEAKRLSLALQRWYRCAISLFFAFGGAWLTTQFKQACPNPKCCSTPLTTANASRAMASTTCWVWPMATKYRWTRCAL